MTSKMRWSIGGAALVLVAVLAVVLKFVSSPQAPLPGSAPPDSSAAAPGLTGRVGPTARSCQGVAVAPADEIQAAIDSNPPGTTFCFAAGTYRLEEPLAPKAGDALIGELGAVLSGSKILTGWQPDGAVWTTEGFLPDKASTSGECDEAAPLCTYAEDVFIDGRRLNRVGSAAEVKPGTVYADYDNNTITIGDAPVSHQVEQAVAPSLIRATVDNVTVANLVIEEAANPAQVGAIETRQIDPYLAGSGWRILDNEIRLNHGVGVSFTSGAIVTGNYIHHQGQLGFGAEGVDGTFSNNELSFNGAAEYSAGWEAGGSKSWATERLRLTHNFVHDNRGPGFWADGGNIDMTYEYNKIVGNWLGGIKHEISYDAVIQHNYVADNGWRRKGWAWDAGIMIQSSGGNKLIDVSQNEVVNNANGITVLDSGERDLEDPAPHGPHVVQNVWVHDNKITMMAGQMTGAVEDRGRLDIFTSRNIRFDSNTYRLSSLTDPHFFWNDDDLDWTDWRSGTGTHDVNGQALLIDS